MDLSHKISTQLGLPLHKVKNTIDLLQNDNTIPFIARYRKEITGNFDEEQIRNVSEALKHLENLESRRQTVLQSITDQGKLNKKLKDQILNASTITKLEDLYLPYRPKRRTRAMIAKEKGLEPLADLITKQIMTEKPLETIIKPFLCDDVPDLHAAIIGASDIVAERISENAVVRQSIRENALKYGKLTCEKQTGADDKRKVYEVYYHFESFVRHLKPYQILAINRGEKEGILKVGLQINDQVWKQPIETEFPISCRSLFSDILIEAAQDSAKRLLLPAIERDIRRIISEQAEAHAITVFAQNVKALLTQPPLFNQTVLAIDPGFRSGSKIVIVDPNGKLLEFATIYPHPPQKKKEEADQIVEALITKHQVTLIVIGNGTASRETESFIANITRKRNDLSYLITSEAGASVYSASKMAREEFPNIDVSIRGAISIARRVQDPLAELVKIDPKSIGVGLYQHDVNQTRLSEALDQVIESVVNSVGVEVNTASAALLAHVSGIGKTLAGRIVQYREINGSFKSRKELQKVAGMGPKTFEQAAGFMRIRESDNPFDATAIHPESYQIAEKLFELIDLSENADSEQRLTATKRLLTGERINHLANKLSTGKPTVEDILKEIGQPGRDPRDDLPKPLLRKDVLSMDDISPDMQLRGTIRNVVDFGAFVDIGVKTDGLLHRSKIEKGMQLKVGDIVDVIIIAIDRDRNRIALKLKERAQG